MARMSKRFQQARESIDKDKKYTLEESCELVKELATAGFDETVEIAVSLNVNPKYAEQMVRGSCVLPNGTGKTARVAVFATGEKADQAKDAGADFVGDEDLAARIQGGWLEFDVVIASPDMMRTVGKLGRVLGPRGLMPNPKIGTVTEDVAGAVAEAKAGKITFRVDKTGNLHVPVGRASFEKEALAQNVMSFFEKVLQLRPSTVKGLYMKNISVSSTMGPGIKIDVNDLRARMR
ncbi:MAG: 50S ribosomal protein L1 [Candidatus Aegiribacteria sp.]|nr:50S ribosomal protein L1 [Candidatus Aegiribacteria sp.]